MYFEGLPFILPSPKGWRHSADIRWRIHRMPAEWHWIPEEEEILPLESVFVVSDSPILGESETTKTGKSERGDYGKCRNRPVSLPTQL
ncbi:hypothetical protein DSO57_1005545 [Entomophthora muscae]|uniref:Uncharacterized protein n=1 Tax=Entomophthora muscae TaxID=34485 RepID=A0ACC2TJT8_9FUNG|nr:hypothetical protein DSO57_1005545 [Entomophthora muscae]